MWLQRGDAVVTQQTVTGNGVTGGVLSSKPGPPPTVASGSNTSFRPVAAEYQRITISHDEISKAFNTGNTKGGKCVCVCDSPVVTRRLLTKRVPFCDYRHV
jgi:hypothetical protein